MARVVLIVVFIGAVLLGIVLLGLGAFPPQPHVAPVEKVLPNDRFHSAGSG